MTLTKQMGIAVSLGTLTKNQILAFFSSWGLVPGTESSFLVRLVSCLSCFLFSAQAWAFGLRQDTVRVGVRVGAALACLCLFSIRNSLSVFCGREL